MTNPNDRTIAEAKARIKAEIDHNTASLNDIRVEIKALKWQEAQLLKAIHQLRPALEALEDTQALLKDLD